MTLRNPSRLLLALLLALAACGGDEASPEAASAPAAAEGGTTAAPEASGSGISEADARALSNYRLNEEDLRRWSEVMRSPEQRAALEDDSDAEEPVDPEDVGSLRALIESNPSYRAAVERAGLTPTRFSIISHVLIAAVSAVEVEKAGMDGDSLARANGIHPANVGFVAEHEAEIRPLLGM